MSRSDSLSSPCSDLLSQPMLSRRGLLGSALLAGGAGLLPRSLFAATDSAAAGQWPHVARLVTGYVDAGKLAGAVALMGRGTEAPVTIARGVGTLGDPRAIDADSLFRAYSMTKPITGMGVMMLIDEGKMQLDQPLADFLPKFARMQVQVKPDGSMTDLRPARTAITIRHLLTHTSGLGYTITQQGPIKAAYEAAGLVPAQVSRIPVPNFTTPHPLPSLAAFADRLAGMPLVYEPGTTWSYSVSLDLLGHVIELVTGQPLDRFLADRIFGPCGMTSSGFRVAPANRERLTTNYAVVADHLVPLDPAPTSVYLDAPAYPFGGAGLVTSPRDYDRFLEMLLGYGTIRGRRVMSEKAVRLGTSDLLPPGIDTRPIGEGNFGFGAGGEVGRGADAGTYGWAGAAGTVGFINYRAGLRAGFYAQFMPPGVLKAPKEFPLAVRADLPAAKAQS